MAAPEGGGGRAISWHAHCDGHKCSACCRLGYQHILLLCVSSRLVLLPVVYLLEPACMRLHGHGQPGDGKRRDGNLLLSRLERSSAHATHRERKGEDVSHDGCHVGGYDIIGSIAAAHTLAASVTAMDCLLRLEGCSGDMVLDSWAVACTITDAIGGGRGHEQPSARQSDDDTAQAGQVLGFWCSCTNATTSTG